MISTCVGIFFPYADPTLPPLCKHGGTWAFTEPATQTECLRSCLAPSSTILSSSVLARVREAQDGENKALLLLDLNIFKAYLHGPTQLLKILFIQDLDSIQMIDV